MLYFINLESVYGREIMIFEGDKVLSEEEWHSIVTGKLRETLSELLRNYNEEVDSLTVLLNESFVRNFIRGIEELGFKLIYASQMDSEFPSVRIDVDVFNDRLAKFNKKEAEKLIGKELLVKILEHNEKVRAEKFEKALFRDEIGGI